MPHKPDQKCMTCAQFQGKANDARGAPAPGQGSGRAGPAARDDGARGEGGSVAGEGGGPCRLSITRLREAACGGVCSIDRAAG